MKLGLVTIEYDGVRVNEGADNIQYLLVVAKSPKGREVFRDNISIRVNDDTYSQKLKDTAKLSMAKANRLSDELFNVKFIGL